MNIPLTRSHEEATIERFRRDPDLVAQYLEAVLKDNDQNKVLQARTLLAKTFGAAAGAALIAECDTLTAVIAPQCAQQA